MPKRFADTLRAILYQTISAEKSAAQNFLPWQISVAQKSALTAVPRRILLLPISAMAKSFARLIFPPKSFDKELREACRQIVSAMINYPEMIGGTQRLDTIIMQTLRGKIISKVGAEGVYLAGVLPSPKWKKGLGIALKLKTAKTNALVPSLLSNYFDNSEF